MKFVVSSLPRLAIALAAVALLGGQAVGPAPILPIPGKPTPTPVARPHAPAKHKPGKPGHARAHTKRGKSTVKAGGKKAHGKPKGKKVPGGAARPASGIQLQSAAPENPWGPATGGFPTGTPSPLGFPATRPGPAGFPARTPGAGKFPAFTPAPAFGGTRPGPQASAYHGFGSPPPTPTPKPPHAMGGPWVLVNWGGIGLTQKTLRYGEPLKLRTARGYHQPIQLLVVDPGSHEDLFSSRPFNRFPGKLNHVQKVAYLGDPSHYKHVHWVVARGYELNVMPEAFLRLYDDVYGTTAGYQWPLRFLFYVVVTPPGRDTEVYYKLVVTIVR